MLAFLYVAVVLAALFGASFMVERLLGRSRKEFKKPGWLLVFYGVFIPGATWVYLGIDVGNPFLYAAYGLAGGVAVLVAQCFFGTKLSERPSSRQ